MLFPDITSYNDCLNENTYVCSDSINKLTRPSYLSTLILGLTDKVL